MTLLEYPAAHHIVVIPVNSLDEAAARNFLDIISPEIIAEKFGITMEEPMDKPHDSTPKI